MIESLGLRRSERPGSETPIWTGNLTAVTWLPVFTSGKYETEETAGWAQGDWDGDGFFDSGDMVTAFVDGGYELGVHRNDPPGEANGRREHDRTLPGPYLALLAEGRGGYAERRDRGSTCGDGRPAILAPAAARTSEQLSRFDLARRPPAPRRFVGCGTKPGKSMTLWLLGDCDARVSRPPSIDPFAAEVEVRPALKRRPR